MKDLGTASFVLWISGISLFLGLFWYLLCSFLSKFSGWQVIASVYGILNLPENAEICKYVNGKLGGFEYRGVLHLHINEMGMGLKTVPLYRIGHVPIFIPWQRIRIIEVDEPAPERNVTFEILGNEGESLGRLTLPASLFRNFESFLMYT